MTVTNPRKFLLGLLSGVIVSAALYLFAFWLIVGVPTDNSRWAYELVQKKLQLAQSTGSPKLLLVGGSATLFGISAEELEKNIGLRTVNLGVHGALGAPYLLDVARRAAKPGDVVLLSLEYDLYNNPKVGGPGCDELQLDYVVARAPEFLKSRPLSEQLTVAMALPFKRLKEGLRNRFAPGKYGKRDFSGIYNPKYIDEWGDQTNHPQAKATSFPHLPSALGHNFPQHLHGLSAIESFCRWAKTKQVTVIATFPAILDQPEHHTTIAQSGIDELKEFYRRNGVVVVGNYTDALLPERDFFDTVYHLTYEAKLQRTERLSKVLAPSVQEAVATRNRKLAAGQ